MNMTGIRRALLASCVAVSSGLVGFIAVPSHASEVIYMNENNSGNGGGSGSEGQVLGQVCITTSQTLQPNQIPPGTRRIDYFLVGGGGAGGTYAILQNGGWWSTTSNYYGIGNHTLVWPTPQQILQADGGTTTINFNGATTIFARGGGHGRFIAGTHGAAYDHRTFDNLAIISINRMTSGRGYVPPSMNNIEWLTNGFRAEIGRPIEYIPFIPDNNLCTPNTVQAGDAVSWSHGQRSWGWGWWNHGGQGGTGWGAGGGGAGYWGATGGGGAGGFAGRGGLPSPIRGGSSINNQHPIPGGALGASGGRGAIAYYSEWGGDNGSGHAIYDRYGIPGADGGNPGEIVSGTADYKNGPIHITIGQGGTGFTRVAWQSGMGNYSLGAGHGAPGVVFLQFRN